MRSIIIFLPVALLTLAGCSSNREFTVTPETLTQAAIAAIADEANVQADQIQRMDEKCENGCVTVLKAPYIDYSKIKVTIDTCGGQTPPDLGVRIVTGSFFYMRHLDWEERFQEVVLAKLLAREHSEESKPSSQPPPPPPDLKHLPPSASAISTSSAETPVIPPAAIEQPAPAAPGQVNVTVNVPTPPPGKPRSFKPLLRALRGRNYRLFFGGQGISLIGTWMTRTATLWLVYVLAVSRTEMMLGLVGFASQIPVLLLAPLAGVYVDRHQRRRLLVLTQILSMLQSFLLAWLTLSGLIQIWHIILLSLFQGVINAVDMPCRQAFLLEMIEEPADLPNAIALNSSMFNGARLLGPSLAGIVIGKIGAGYCFLADGLSYLAVIASLLAMVVRPRKLNAQRRKIWPELREGFAYAFGFTPLRAVLLMLAMISMMGMFYAVLMPVFATKILHGDSKTYGWLMAAPGLGALLGALFLASRSSVRGLGRVIVWAGCLFGAAQVAFASSRLLWLSLLLLLLAGLGMMVQIASSNTILQTISAESKRGRVMSFYAMALVGTAPFGSLLAGALAQWLGAPAAVRVGGCCCVLSALLFLRKLPEIRALLRPLYVEKGIIKEQ